LRLTSGCGFAAGRSSSLALVLGWPPLRRLPLVLVTPSAARNLLRNLLALVLVWPKAERSEA